MIVYVTANCSRNKSFKRCFTHHNKICENYKLHHKDQFRRDLVKLALFWGLDLRCAQQTAGRQVDGKDRTLEEEFQSHFATFQCT